MKTEAVKRTLEDMVYTVEEVAEIMKTSKQYVYSLVNAHQLRIRKSELERFFKDNEGKDLSNPNEPKDIVS